jgi:hypothetical protein
VQKRQLLLFKIGCWAALVTAAVHLFGHVAGPQPAANEIEEEIIQKASSYQFELPGGGRRALMDLMNGFSLSFPVFLATLAGAGLMIAKRGDVLLVQAAARVFAAGSIALLVISFTHWFIIPTIFIAFFTLCFVLASVPRPEGE